MHRETSTLTTNSIYTDTRSQPFLDDPVARLRRAYPWPGTKPNVSGPIENPGWLGEGTDRVLDQALTRETRVVVELGAWLGMSTRYIADRAPDATFASAAAAAAAAGHDPPVLAARLHIVECPP